MEVEFLEGLEGVLRRNVLLLVLHADVVGNVCEEVHECVGGENDQIDCVLLPAYIERKRLFNYLVYRSCNFLVRSFSRTHLPRGRNVSPL